MNLDKKMILLMQALVNVILFSYFTKAVQKNTLRIYTNYGLQASWLHQK